MSNVLRKQWFFYLCCVLTVIVLRPVYVPVGAGLLMAYLSERPLQWLQQRLHWHGNKTRALLAFCFIFLTTAIFLLPLIGASYQAAKRVYEFSLAGRGDQTWGQLFQTSNTWIQSKLGGLEQAGKALGIPSLTKQLHESALAAVKLIAQTSSQWLQATPAVLLDGLLFFMGWFFCAWAGPGPREQFLKRLLPFEHERTLLSTTTAQVIRGLVVSNVLVSVAQAIVCTAFLLIFRVPSAWLLGVLAFFVSFIPVIGTALVTGAATLYLFLNHRIAAGIGMLVVAGVVSTIDNFLRPFLLKGSLPLGFFWTLVAFVGGVAVFGIAGALLGPLALSLCAVALQQPPPPSVLNRGR